MVCDILSSSANIRREYNDSSAVDRQIFIFGVCVIVFAMLVILYHQDNYDQHTINIWFQYIYHRYIVNIIIIKISLIL